jgi:hypothetical protein
MRALRRSGFGPGTGVTPRISTAPNLSNAPKFAFDVTNVAPVAPLGRVNEIGVFAPIESVIGVVIAPKTELQRFRFRTKPFTSSLS